MKLQDFAIIGGVLYFLAKAAAKAAYDNFAYKSAKIAFGRVMANGVSGEAIITVTNKTGIPLTVQSIAGSIKYTGLPVAEYMRQTPFTVAANSDTAIRIPFFVPYSGLSAAVISAITTKQFDTYATIEGVARAANINIPFSFPVSPI